MLRITTTDTPTEQVWVLEGRLTVPWISELKSKWKEAQGGRQGKTCVVDLKGVTFIDKDGERVLLAMAKEGARFVARGVYTKHVVEHLENRRKAVAKAEPGGRSRLSGRRS